MAQLHWCSHIRDAAKCRELAEQAELDGRTLRHNYWKRIEREKVEDARKEQERQKQMSWNKP